MDMKKKLYIILYDIGRGKNATRLRVSRELGGMDAKMFQHSVWEHEDVNKLMEIVSIIRANGGKAVIMEKKIVYE